MLALRANELHRRLDKYSLKSFERGPVTNAIDAWEHPDGDNIAQSTQQNEQSSFDEWYSWCVDAYKFNEVSMKVRPVADVDCKLLFTRSDKWKFDGKLDAEQLKTPGSIVHHINVYLKSRRFFSHFRDVTSYQKSTPPVGLYVLDKLPLTENVFENAYEEIQELFADEYARPTEEASPKAFKLAQHNTQEASVGQADTVNDFGKTFLFYHKNPAQYFDYVLKFLFRHRPALAEFVLFHGLAYVKLLGGTEADLKKCSLTFVKYTSGSGLHHHVDGVEDFDQTYGPIFTLAIGKGIKKLDMFPALVKNINPPLLPPVVPCRITTLQYQSILLQGPARAAYTHGVPFGNPEEQITIAYKFPAFTTEYPRTDYTIPSPLCEFPYIHLPK